MKISFYSSYKGISAERRENYIFVNKLVRNWKRNEKNSEMNDKIQFWSQKSRKELVREFSKKD